MSAFDAYVRLDASLEGQVIADEVMAKHTSYRIGGPAALYLECRSVPDLALALDVLSEEEVEWTALGRGSNLLVSDRGYEGAVISCGGGLSRFTVDRPDDVDAPVSVTVGAGHRLSSLVQKAYGESLSGLEFAIGIPGSVGGGVFMNAGAVGDALSGIVTSVTSYKRGRGLVCRRAGDIDWKYRSSGLPADELIVECTLALHPEDKGAISERMEQHLFRRRSRQPLDLPSCGSVFKNPHGAYAADLIEGCGLKGLSCNGAQISDKHANFIVNTGGATAQDVLTLIHSARDHVKEEYGIELHPEVRFLGFA